MASEVNSKQLHFWTQKSIICAQNFSQSLHEENLQNASELHSKFLRLRTHKSRKCAQNLFINVQAVNFPTASELFLTARCISMLWPANGLNRENASPTSFKTQQNFVLWNFLQWRKLRPNLQVRIFKIFVGWCQKNVPVFFGLEGTLPPTTIRTHWRWLLSKQVTTTVYSQLIGHFKKQLKSQRLTHRKLFFNHAWLQSCT